MFLQSLEVRPKNVHFKSKNAFKMAENSVVPRSREEYITLVSEEIEGRVTKHLSQEFSRTESHILGSLSRLDDFLLNALIQGHSGLRNHSGVVPD